LLQSVVFFVTGVVCLLFVYRVSPFNMTEFDVLNPLRDKHPIIIKVCSAILIGYALLNVFWPA
jgi:hypothetical protein